MPMRHHVIPINDDRKHLVSSACWCHPVNRDGIIVHNSADCREAVENLIDEALSDNHPWGVYQEPT